MADYKDTQHTTKFLVDEMVPEQKEEEPKKKRIVLTPPGEKEPDKRPDAEISDENYKWQENQINDALKVLNRALPAETEMSLKKIPWRRRILSFLNSTIGLKKLYQSHRAVPLSKANAKKIRDAIKDLKEIQKKYPNAHVGVVVDYWGNWDMATNLGPMCDAIKLIKEGKLVWDTKLERELEKDEIFAKEWNHEIEKLKSDKPLTAEKIDATGKKIDAILKKVKSPLSRRERCYVALKTMATNNLDPVIKNTFIILQSGRETLQEARREIESGKPALGEIKKLGGKFSEKVKTRLMQGPGSS
jgi:hypothetical protein